MGHFCESNLCSVVGFMDFSSFISWALFPDISDWSAMRRGPLGGRFYELAVCWTVQTKLNENKFCYSIQKVTQAERAIGAESSPNMGLSCRIVFRKHSTLTLTWKLRLSYSKYSRQPASFHSKAMHSSGNELFETGLKWGVSLVQSFHKESTCDINIDVIFWLFLLCSHL